MLTLRAQKKLTDYFKRLGEHYGTTDVYQAFAATPSVEQRLQDKITLKSDFLGKINVLGVRDKVGEKVLGGITKTVTKRTNTANNDRVPVNVVEMDDKGYVLLKTESDIAIPYDLLDSWSKFPDFNQRITTYILRAMALDRIRIGWHGTSAAADTDNVVNPNLQDVNKGWLQHLREYAAGSQVLDEGANAGQIRIGSAAGADYANLDALVHDVSQMIAEEHQEAGDLVAIIGRGLLANDKAKLYTAQGQTPTEKERIETQQVIATYGGLRAFTVPFMPSAGLIVTSWDNLSIYYQEQSWRRKYTDNAKRDQYEDYNSRNEGYVIEDETKAAAIEAANVVFTWA